MSYRALTEASVLGYVRERGALRDVFSSFDLTASEVGDGNLNQVFILRNPDKPNEAAVLKQALPYLRVAGDSWPLSRERMRFETGALRLYNDLTPGLVPRVYDHDEDMSVVVMEYLSEHEVMRKPLVARERFPNFAEHISHFLAQTLFHTSDLFLSGEEKKAQQKEFINPHLCKLQENFVYTNPYKISPENQWNPELEPQVQAVRSNGPLKAAIAELKHDYMTRAQALLHGDLHTGSLMVTESDTKVIDPEFAFYGPMGSDIGTLFANLVLNALSHTAHTPDEEARKGYQEYLLDTVCDIWQLFSEKFERLWTAHQQSDPDRKAYWDFAGGEEAFRAYQKRYLTRVLQDSAGHGGCEMLRRMMGIVSVWDLSSIEDVKARAVAERLAVRVGSSWITNRAHITTIDALLEVVRGEMAGRSERPRPFPKPALPFSGKVALITGAASGIGRACAEAFSEAGAAVVALDIRSDVEALFDEEMQKGLVCDVTDEDALRKAVDEAVRLFGRLDIVVSNAGIFPASRRLEEMQNETWSQSLEVNLTSHQRLIKASIPHLRQGADATIIIVGSKNVAAPGPGAGAYSVAKAGLTQLARVAALELAEQGIRVNVVHPDAVFDTGIWTEEVLQKRAQHYGLTVEQYRTKNLLRTEITSQSVAEVVLALAGPAFSKTTGAQIPVDGGNDRVI